MDNLDSSTVAIIISLSLGLVTIAVFLFLKFFSAKKDTVLLAGLSNSGKTTIFTQLVSKSNNIPQTYTSMQENTIHLNIKGNVLKITDYPGNDRLRQKLLSTIRQSSIRKIVYVIDAATFSKESRDVAELLYDILLENQKNHVPILVACHKQDHSLSKTDKVIQNSLEKEIGLINKSRSAALIGTDGSEARRSTLTNTGTDFKWDDLKRQNISFKLTSSRSDDFGIDAISSFVKN
ncbi:unnamed protein product [Caenorhabditis angaria]|uniref:Signal recognition particle receptor subunit beta n=1 Tax=Caenorhabditis angaria TaxID=860376 RepID=A0A9P1IYT6_9PELO|nr:unnamed protein product [Caenorhabditis angaria]